MGKREEGIGDEEKINAPCCQQPPCGGRPAVGNSRKRVQWARSREIIAGKE